jgi:hypothetical protein
MKLKIEYVCDYLSDLTGKCLNVSVLCHFTQLKYISLRKKYSEKITEIENKGGSE